MNSQYQLNHNNTGLDWLILDFTETDGDVSAEIDEQGFTVAYRGGFETVDQARYWIDEYFLAMSD